MRASAEPADLVNAALPHGELLGGDRAFLRNTVRPGYESGPNPLAVVDLFAGCGGLSLGAAEACRAKGRGIDVRFAVEFEQAPWEVFKANHRPRAPSGPASIESIFDGKLKARATRAEAAARTLIGGVDLMVGGPPCQGHSNLNNHTRRRDPKNALYLRMVRAVEVLMPSYVLIENVPAVQHDVDGVVEQAAVRLEAIGYRVDEGVVSIGDLGIAQLRSRHVLLASLASRPSIESMVERSSRPSMTLRDAIEDLVAIRAASALDEPGRLSSANLARASWLLENDEYDLPNEKRPPCHRDKPDHRYKSMYGRLHWDRPAQTITTGFCSPGQGRFLHPSEPRTLTAHEAARLQFFPDWYDFSPIGQRTALATMIGNAVPPKLAFAAVLELLSTG